VVEEGFHRETHTLLGDPVLSENVRSTDVWAIKVASFAHKDKAVSFRTELRDDGYEAFQSTIKNGNITRYRVAVGPLLDFAEAETLQQELSGQYEVEARLMAFTN
ncbi:MAG: SPOR domain-containing protein, partial [Gammaproteobacteria bacterium]|nr:SPOR domain-containing protein [Gammaproteobacteria bacterium]